MSLPEIHATYRLAKMPTLKGITTPDGRSVHVLALRVAASRSVYNTMTRKWETKSQLFIDVDYFGDDAHVLGGKLNTGTEVYIGGELVTDEWTDKTTGDKRSKIKINARRLRPVMPVPTVQPLNAGRSTHSATPNTGHPGGATSTTPSATAGGDSDPWGSQTALNADGDGNPPF